MKVRVDVFKPSGSIYTDEYVELPDDCFPWDARKYIEKYLDGRLTGMTAYIGKESPWGYPVLLHNLNVGHTTEIVRQERGK